MEEFLNHQSRLLSLSQGYVKLLFLLLVGALTYQLSKALFWAIRTSLKKRITFSVELFNTKFRIASGILMTLVVLNLFLPVIQFSHPEDYYIKKALFAGFLFSLAFLLIKITEFSRDYIYLHKTDINNNLSDRKIRTQIGFLQKVSSLFIILIAFSIFLMSFNRVREIGTSIIASAGIAGVIIGFAAQKSIANLLAGMQIAVTQPIRIHDTVVVENEWGKIEEITLTYVVVKLWDERRLVLPIYYFIEKPFQNWTRTSSDIVGSVMLYVDYSMPVGTIRAEMKKILEASPLWDKRVFALQVVDCTEKSMQLRGIMSSDNAADSFDLRCLVREKLIAFINENAPGSLPLIRSKNVLN
jgi:small-conductance mechanosensitive channel